MSLANDPIMSGRLIRSFRHLQCQNPSIISDFIGINVGCKICDTQNTDGTQNSSSIIFRLLTTDTTLPSSEKPVVKKKYHSIQSVQAVLSS